MPRSKRALCKAKPSLLRERRDGAGTSTSVAYAMREEESPSWPAVEAALRRLDNGEHSEVSLELDMGRNRTSLIVGGGNEGRVVCCIARPDDPAWGQGFRHVVDPDWRDGTFEQVIGGQTSDLPARLSVPLATAVEAARYFFEHRALHPDLRWEVP